MADTLFQVKVNQEQIDWWIYFQPQTAHVPGSESTWRLGSNYGSVGISLWLTRLLEENSLTRLETK
jgi:hypothetical protein